MAKNNTKKFTINKNLRDKWAFWEPDGYTCSLLIVFFLLSCVATRVQTYQLIKEWLSVESKITLSRFFNTLFTPLYEVYDVNNLMALHAGIGAVLVALAFFVAQSLGSKKNTEEGRVLMRRSKFFPLLSCEVLVFILFLGQPNVLLVLLVGLIALWTVIALYRVTQVLFNPILMMKESERTLFESARKGFIAVLDQEITARKRANSLFQEYENDLVFSMRPSYYRSEEIKTYRVMSHDSGRFEDFDTGKLKKLISYLQQCLKEIPEASDSPEITSIDAPDLVPNTALSNLRVRLNSVVKLDSILLEIDTSKLKEYDPKIIDKLAESAFIIKNDHIAEEARFGVNRLMERCLDSIKLKKEQDLNSVLNLYSKLMVAFFEYVDGGLSVEQANNEQHPFSQKLESFNWFSSDVHKIFIKGINSDDLDIVSAVARFPIRIMRESIKYNDHCNPPINNRS